MLTAALLLATAAAGPFDGRMPARGDVERAVASGRHCSGNAQGAGPCPSAAALVRDVRCRPISTHGRGAFTRAGARCSFRYGEPGVTEPRGGARQSADFYLVGLPCGGEGQEADVICYDWMISRERN
jgi:hypothetical protein